MIKIFEGISEKAQIQANDFVKRVGGRFDIKEGNIVIEYDSLDKIYTLPIPMNMTLWTDDEVNCAHIVKVEVLEDKIFMHQDNKRVFIVTKDKNNTCFIEDELSKKSRLVLIRSSNNIDVDYYFEMIESEKFNVDNWKEKFEALPNIHYEDFLKWLDIDIIQYGVLGCQTEKLEYLIKQNLKNEIDELIEPLIERLTCISESESSDHETYMKNELYRKDIHMEKREVIGRHDSLNLQLDTGFYFGGTPCFELLNELKSNRLNGVTLMICDSRSPINKYEDIYSNKRTDMDRYEHEDYLDNCDIFERAKKTNMFLVKTYKKIKHLELKIAKFDAINSF